MRICIISDTFPPESIGGIQTYSYEFAYHLALNEKVEKVVVFALNGSHFEEESVTDKFEVYRLNGKNPFHWLRMISMILILNPDLIHSTTTISSVYFSNLSKYILRKNYFINIYGLDALSSFYHPEKRRRMTDIIRKSKGIIFISDFSRNEVCDFYAIDGIGKAITIYPGVSVPEIDSDQIPLLKGQYSYKNDDFIVLSVGRLVSRKGVDDLIKAIDGINDDEVKALIVGTGPESDRLRELVRQLHLENRVIFTGKVDSVYPYYPLADVFCMPSKYFKEKGDVEGLGLVSLEAQSYGIPVLGTRSGGVPETLIETVTGFLVEEGDSEGMIDAILSLKENETQRKEMGENAKAFVRKKFSWERCIEEHLAYYNSHLDTTNR